MTALSVDELQFRSKEAWKKRQLWEADLEDVYELVMPDKDPYKENKEQPRNRSHLFDSTASTAVHRGANRLQTELTPPDQTWFDLKAGPLVPKKEADAINKLLESTTSLTSIIFKSGNFVQAIHELYLDLITSGLGAMLVLENPKSHNQPAIFQTVSQAEIAIDEGPYGDVEGIFRKRKDMNARLIDRTWTDLKNVPEELSKQMKDTKQEHKVDIDEANDNPPAEDPKTKDDPPAADPKGDGDPAPSGDVYRPEGLADHYVGGTDQETIDKLHKAVDGFRKQQAKAKDEEKQAKAPETPDGYELELSDEIKSRFIIPGEDGKDPIFEKAKELAHKADIPADAFQEFMAGFMEVSHEMFPIESDTDGDNPANMDFDFESYGGVEKAAPVREAAVLRIDGLSKQGKISDEVAEGLSFG